MKSPSGPKKTNPKQTQFKPNFKRSLAQTIQFATLERLFYNEAPESLLANQMELSDKLT